MSDMSEEELKALLASLYKEPEKDDRFEERFTLMFHERVVQSAVSPPVSRRLWDDVCYFFANMTMPKLAYSTVAVVALFAVFSSVSFLPTGGTSTGMAAQSRPNLVNLRASLSDVLGSDGSQSDNTTVPENYELPARFGIQFAPQKPCDPNYTGSNVMTHQHRPVYTDGMTIYIEPGDSDTTLNIKLVEQH